MEKIEERVDPLAAMESIANHGQWTVRREAFFDRLEAMAEAADLPPDEAEALTTEAVRAVRQAGRSSG